MSHSLLGDFTYDFELKFEIILRLLMSTSFVVMYVIYFAGSFNYYSAFLGSNFLILFTGSFSNTRLFVLWSGCRFLMLMPQTFGLLSFDALCVISHMTWSKV